MRVLSHDEAALLLALPTARRDLSALRDAPVVAVEVDADGPSVPLLRELPVVSIGIGHAGEDFDVIVEATADAAEVAAAVAANPHAAVTLVQLLRLQPSLTLPDALVAESLAYAALQGGGEFTRWLEGRGERVRRPETEPPVHTDRQGDTLVITLNRPRLRNLYSAAMRDALVDALEVAAADPALLVELRGAGKSFSAGGDLAEFGTTRDTAQAHLIRSTANAAPHLASIADRVTAYLHGAAVGAGIELAAFAGRVIASPDTSIALPEVSMGLIPGAGGTVSIARRIGRQRTAWLALTGTRIDAYRALLWGLVDEVSPG